MVWIVCILCFFCCSCQQKPQERHYTEIVVKPSMSVSAAMPASGLFSWQTPHGWQEEEGSQMRLVSFYPADHAIDCYITALPGDAGGLNANIRRWLSQLGIEKPDQTKLHLESTRLQTRDGLTARVFDFTDLQSEITHTDKSMMAAVIRLDDETVFVKMTGTIEALRRNKADYFQLIESLGQ